ncbi:MAG: hypothetical protein KKH28_05940 [Elusimicrobia bacterium]|nr:hypothetical protein [Elusimicrobiota bacterium]
MSENVKLFDGKKFMWDGKVHDTREPAREAENTYKENAFETRLVNEDGKYLVYSRRVAAQQTAAPGQ